MKEDCERLARRDECKQVKMEPFTMHQQRVRNKLLRNIMRYLLALLLLHV